MKRNLTILFSLLALPVFGQAPFDSGSNGSYGVLNISGYTVIDVPPDGIFHCTTVNIAHNNFGPSLILRKNAANTPVYILATGDVNINGAIEVSGLANSTNGTPGGEGGPGGFKGGTGGTANEPPGAGQGPGGGRGGAGSISQTSAGGGAFGTSPTYFPERPANGVPYGNRLLFPLIGGSGGGGSAPIGETPGYGGGGGGGAILIASSTKIEFTSRGLISARGASNAGSGHGSGGAIRLVAPVVKGTTASLHDPLGYIGGLDVRGGAESNVDGQWVCWGGLGRTRIDTLDRSQIGIDGVQSIGNLMVVFHNPLPKLRVTSAAGTNISEANNNPVTVFLPSGTPASQPITVRARDFGEVVPIRVALIPELGDPVFTDATIDNSANNPADTIVNVTIPVNVQVSVQVWTR